MNNAIYISQEQSIDVTAQIIDLNITESITVEGWLKLSPLDKKVRLYPEPHFKGKAVSLKIGTIAELDAGHLPRLASIEIPPNLDVVLFTEKYFQGKALPLREDSPVVSTNFQQIQSVAILDRSHQRSSAVVLFENENYLGKAQILLLPYSWQKGEPQNENALATLTSIKSAWIPPGAAIEIRIANGDKHTFTEDCSSLPGDITQINTHLVKQRNDFDLATAMGQLMGMLSNENIDWGIYLQKKESALISIVEYGFAGKTLRTGKWHHIGMVSDGNDLSWYLDGKCIKKEDKPFSLPAKFILGKNLKGSIANLRVWDTALTAEQISDNRYPDIPCAPTKVIVGENNIPTDPENEIHSFVAQLPKSPQNSPFVTKIKQQIIIESTQKKHQAQLKANILRQKAERLAQAKLSAAREKAKREIHLQGMKNISFIREGNLINNVASDKGLKFSEADKIPNVRIVDTAQNNNGEIYIAVDGNYWGIKRVSSDYITPSTPTPISTFTIDDTGKSPLSRIDGNVYTVVYWIEQDGYVCYALDFPNSAQTRNVLFDEIKVPLGRPTIWDMVLDDQNQILYWINGQEIYQANLLEGKPSSFEILSTYTHTPFPIALAAAPNKSLVWIDAETETMYCLSPYEDKNTKALYQTPKPGKGLAVCHLGENNTAYVYWVSALRKSLDVPILDNPGKYIDLHDGQRESIGEVKLIGEHARWAVSHELIPLKGRFGGSSHFEEEDILLGEFQQNRALVLELKVKLIDINRHYASSYYGTEHVLLTIFGFNEPLQICHNCLRHGMTYIGYNNSLMMPYNQWIDLRIEISPNQGSHTGCTITMNGNVIYSELIHFYSLISNYQVYLTPKSFELPSGMASASGYYLEASVAYADAPTNIVSKITPSSTEGNVRIGKKAIQSQIFLNETSKGVPTSILTFDTPYNFVAFDAIWMNLHQGFSATASLILDDLPNAKNVCVYELATFEDEDRLVCSIDKDGVPRIHLRWAGKTLSQEVNVLEETRITTNIEYQISWCIDQHLNLITYIGDVKIWEGKINERLDEKVFIHHQLGAPNQSQEITSVVGATLYEDDNPIHLEGMQGKILRFQAWNTYLPNAMQASSIFLAFSPNWSRNLLITESKQQYLQAGKLDGSEPPVTLFPIDLDGGLSIETALDEAHALYARAHSEHDAATALALKMKQKAVNDALNKKKKALVHLQNVNTQSNYNISVQENKTANDKNEARQNKVNADNLAEQKRLDGKKRADQTILTGKQQAEKQEQQAADKKRNKIAQANKHLNDKRTIRDQKQQEYDRKR